MLLTDGQNTAGPDPAEAAQAAADRGIKVYTVGLGTAEGRLVESSGVGIMVRLDEETLRKVADITRARYFHAATGADLDSVYEGLQARLVLEKQDTEVTALLALAGSVLLLLSAGLSSLWFGRVA